MPSFENQLLSKKKEAYNSKEYVEVLVDVDGTEAEFLSHSRATLDVSRAPSLAGQSIEISGIRQDLIGTILIGDSAVGLVRIVKDTGGQMVLTKMDPDAEKFTYLEMISPGERVVLGREKINEEDKTISKEHLVIDMDEEGELIINDVSTNGSVFVTEKQSSRDSYKSGISGLKNIIRKRKHSDTLSVDVLPFIKNPKSWSLSGPISKLIFEEDHKKSGQANWDYTFMPSQQKRLGINIRGYEEPYIDDTGREVPAMFNGRPVISRESAINGGAYIVPGSQEAIVVDDGTRPKEGDRPKEMNQNYQKAFNDFIENAKRYGLNVRNGVRENQLDSLLASLLESVSQTIQYDLEYSEYIGNAYKDRKINLDEFLVEGRGVCRHQALLAGYILERLVNNGFMSGKVSVDRNYVKDMGGHAWTRYTDEKGRVYIIDPSNGYSGRLNKNTKRIWSYNRPDEQL